ncbi:N-acetyl-alpha-D-glucosaminyl L-malate synthase BshA [Opitutales bacterium ASA1]|uniref:N-acetyl-alpha-D-glucosaminyl L-malate synthase BshA n=1 Tax=Congregicoccus parvus TaxID=3081749 RepID=UPI002B29F961|nr:N-acetyl-alpha-D-glucosaminyl L-malate synthase BshA [Opitutales bacterium ASA1]
MTRPLRIGITCYPSVGGSGIVATELGEELAARGHDVHFVSYGRPFRLAEDKPRIAFHPVVINDYELFRYPDYTLPLSVKMAEVARDHALDVLHVHYAVPHATAAILACDMLPPDRRPKVVTTLHGTDTTLLGRDAGYGPAIRHALERSDAVTTVSDFLRRETHRLLAVERSIDVVHNFFDPHVPSRSSDAVRAELGLDPKTKIVLHASNLRPVKRIDLLLAAFACVPREIDVRLLVLAGSDFAPHREAVLRLGIEDRVVVREKVVEIEDYLQIADAGLFTSDSESFCVSILEAMNFAVPSVARAVGGIPEVTEHGVSGLLIPPSAPPSDIGVALAGLLSDDRRRRAMGSAAHTRARESFSVATVVPRYEALYRRVLGAGSD